MDQHTMLAISAFILLSLGLIWRKGDWFNVYIKVTLFTVGVVNIIIILK